VGRFSPTQVPERGPGFADFAQQLARALDQRRERKRQQTLDTQNTTQLGIENTRADERLGLLRDENRNQELERQVRLANEGYRAGTAPASDGLASAVEAQRGNLTAQGTAAPMAPPLDQRGNVTAMGTTGAPTSLTEQAGRQFYIPLAGGQGFIDPSQTPEARAESRYQTHTTGERQYEDRVRGEGVSNADRVRQEGFAHEDTTATRRFGQERELLHERLAGELDQVRLRNRQAKKSTDAGDEAEGQAIMATAHPPVLARALSRAWNAILAANPGMSEGRAAKQAYDAVTKVRPDLEVQTPSKAKPASAKLDKDAELLKALTSDDEASAPATARGAVTTDAEAGAPRGPDPISAARGMVQGLDRDTAIQSLRGAGYSDAEIQAILGSGK
jgi:hypothetical protein